MKSKGNQTIIAEIQPLCDAFCQKVKEEKKKQGKTNQDIAEWTGVPISNINKFLAGTLAIPNVYYIASICVYLGISMDEAFGIKSEDAYESTKVQLLEHDLEREKKIDQMNEATINNLRKEYKILRTLCISLIALCLLMAYPLVRFMLIDAKYPDDGFILNGKLTWLGMIAFCAICALSCYVLNLIVAFFKKRKGKDGSHE